MDFFDPKKRRRRKIRLISGYVFMALVVAAAVALLIYKDHGYGYRHGHIVHYGLVFASSRPAPAGIYLDSGRIGATDTRLKLVAGRYTMRLKRPGYRTWQRKVRVHGGSVERIDYPLLVPKDVPATPLVGYPHSPVSESQSPSRRWLLVGEPGSLTTFDLYDLKNPKKVMSSTKRVRLPAGLLSDPQAAHQAMDVVEWSNDNQHVLLKHTYGAKAEYILLDTKNPEQSQNLDQALGEQLGTLTLRNKQSDQYFVYDKSSHLLSTISLSSPQIQPLLPYVLAYKTYGKDTVLYATARGAPKGEVNIELYKDGHSYVIRRLPKAKHYHLDYSTYNGDWYAVVAAPGEKHTYVYRDPARFKQDHPTSQPPIRAALPVAANFVQFSASSRFILAEHGKHIGVYDTRYKHMFAYDLAKPLAKPLKHAHWIDNAHIAYASSAGKLRMLDFDGTNRQKLSVSLPEEAFFSTDYQQLYTFAPPKNSKLAHAQVLSRYWLLTPRDR